MFNDCDARFTPLMRVIPQFLLCAPIKKEKIIMKIAVPTAAAAKTLQSQF
jgi:hypothetical protein